MQKLSFLILLLIVSISFAQSPHGENFDIDCEECHATDKWDIDYKKLEFNHVVTGFELVGQHNTLDCRNCHATILFSEINNQCSSCHTDIHQNSVGTNCENCHTSDSWLVKNTNELHMMSRFPLEGAHKNANCIDCHTSSNNLVFEPIGIDCIDCHRPDYQSAKFPDHVAAGFSTDCQECHQITDLEWSKAKITHDFFPLVGGHNVSNCFDCHNQNTFEELTQDCYTCHQSDYSSTAEPNHITNNFSTNCTQCHTTNPYWRPASFTDHNNFFQLVGAHKLIENDCSKCHDTGYRNTPNQCYDCHKNNYNNTSNPSHQSAGFGTDCESCHNSNAWQPASFDHDNQFFPIYSGKHNNEWNNCSDCHTNSSDYQVFSCITCHEHNQTEMNDEHSGINGYTYESTACFTCHPTGDGEGGFNHSNTNFPLIGAHVSNECSDCHASGYQGTSTVCSDCHTNDFQASTNPNHQQLALDQNCEQCHTTNPDWQPASFAVHNDFYMLDGAHSAISNDCNTCHNGDYVNTGNLCADCHGNDFNSTTNPNHQQLALDQNCEQCHTTNPDWQPASFAVHNDFYLIEGAHVAVSNDCNTCHNGDYINTGNLCIDCHTNDYNNTTNPNHQTTGFGSDCETCHTQNAWEPAEFDHDNQFFPIYSGNHNNEWDDCADCHTTASNFQVFECINCHEHNKNDTDKDHSGVQGYQYLSLECLACHPTGSEDGAFNHSTSAFPLLGQHSVQECSDCHISGYANTPSECSECHQSDYKGSLDPNHNTAGVSLNCEECHSSSSWKPSNFNHATTGFELAGGHNLTQCSDCHSTSTSNASPNCYECHQTNYESATKHVSRSYPTTCEDCHSATSWDATTFDHNNTNFALTGVHSSEPCSSCHSNGYAGTSTDCYACHQTNFANSVNPNHSAAGISNTCEDCHSSSNWTQSTFNHKTTGFELVGGHNLTQCSDCHSVSTSNASPVCYECHQSNYESALEHKSQNYPKTCEDCHSTTTWDDATFDHNITNFALTGAHSSEPCSSCHSSGYAGTPTECFSCHESNFNNSANPNHSQAGISNQCEDCHSTNTWEPSSFSHSATGFELVGGHNISQCSDCHSVSTSNASPVCYECHQSNYESAPEHTSQNYPKTCEDCHSTTTWDDATFDHNSTNFALTGAHTSVNCSDCHTAGYSGTSTVCSDCHVSDYNGSTNPSHSNLGLATNCENCHTTNSNWQPASFSVHNDYYVLQGAHSSIANDCSTCHSGNYTSTPNTCYQCHTSDYNSTTNPAHQSSGFGTDCEDCHSQNVWKPSTFDHDAQYFPIYSGKHKDEWNNCSDCHTNSSNFSQFSCIDCHEHTQGRMDNKHKDENNYVYESSACLNCHPNGRDEAFFQRRKGKER